MKNYTNERLGKQKKLRVLLLSIATIFACELHGYSQSKEIDALHVKGLRDTALIELKKIANRQVNVVSSSEVKVLYTVTWEFLPPNSRRSVLVRSSESGGERRETIEIDGKKYVKADNSAWKLEPVPASPRSPDRYTALPVPRKIDVKHKKNELLGNSQTDFYEMTELSTTQAGNGTFEIISIDRYWFNKNGTIAKHEKENRNSSRKGRYLSVITYEYDQKIKIEAPIP